MNLKENYNRFFKTNLRPKQETSILTPEQKQRFTNLAKLCAEKYPNAPLTLKEGWVWFGGKKKESIQEFLNRPSLQIQEMVRSFSNSQSKRLL